MEQEETTESRAKVFESENIYLQWLYRRRAMPMRLNRILLRILWLAAATFLIFYWSRYAGGILPGILMSVSGFIIFFLPVLFTFLYLLYYAPLAIETDLKSSLMQFIFISPVPTWEIVSNLRGFIFRQHLMMVIPTLVVLLLIVSEGITQGNYTYLDITDLFSYLIAGSLPVLFYWFLLESGIASAGLPRVAYSSGLVFLLWVIPILVAIFWGGYHIAKWLSIFWFENTGIYREYWSDASPISFLDWEGWLVLHYDIFLIAAGLIARHFSYRFMACKRAGYWGA